MTTIRLQSTVTRAAALGASRLLALIVTSAGLIPAACDQPDSPDSGEPPAVTQASLATLGVERVIPLRFVAYSSPTSPAPTDAQFASAVEVTNAAYRSVGLQFFVRAIHRVADPIFDSVDTAPYTWPSPPGQSSVLVFRPDCPFTPPAEPWPLQPGAGWLEPNAMMWAGAFCSFDDEILIYSAPELPFAGVNQGTPPVNGRVVILYNRSIYQAPFGGSPWPSTALAHEIGHYLGVGHSFEGDALNAATGQITQADAWDLVYAPQAGGNKYFRTREEAAPFEGSLLPIDTQQGVWCGTSPCTGLLPVGAIRLDVPTPNSVDTLITGDWRLRGISMTTAGQAGINAMSYYGNAPASLPPYFSESQALAIRRVLRFDLFNNNNQISSRRTKLGRSVAVVPTPKLNFDGVGGRDLATYDFLNSRYQVLPSGSNNAYSGTNTINVPLGQAGDLAIPADYDADGKTDYAVMTYALDATGSDLTYIRWCPSSVTVNQGSNRCARVEKIQWGARGDVIITDVNFDGTSSTPEIAAYRPSGSLWFSAKLVKPAASAPAGEFAGSLVSGSVQQFQYPGGPAAEPILADYDGDGKTDIALFDPPSAYFAARLSSESLGTIRTIAFPVPANAAERPLVVHGRKNQSGKAVATVWYPGDGTGGKFRMVWNVSSRPVNWVWDGGPGTSSVSISSPNSSSAAEPIPGSFDLESDGVSDVGVFWRNSDGKKGSFSIIRMAPLGAGYQAKALVTRAVATGAGELRLMPFTIPDMKGDGKAEFGVFNPETMHWTIFPSDSPFNFSSTWAFFFGSQGGQPL